jgi:Phytanoyl-CoA dioxygenase (PhyH)
MTGLSRPGHHAGVDIDSFVRDGFVAVRQAVDADTAAACRDLIWTAMGQRGVRQDDSGTWRPLVEAGSLGLSGESFTAAYMAPALTAAYDELIGPGRWKPSVDIGESVVVRFPSEDRANAGYHVEGSYPGPAGQHWRVNVRSRGRGLLALFLFTDVGPDDAPTRLVHGSHLTVARFLAPYGETGTDADTQLWYPSTLCRPVAHATGTAGDVFLCHPFIVHTATWPHRGTGPRVIAQPAVGAPAGFALDGTDPSPVARAIMDGLAMAD